MSRPYRFLPALLLLIGLPAAARAQASGGRDVLTRAESSDYRETSRYSDVRSFLAALDGGPLQLGSFGYSMEGRSLPLVRVGDPGAPLRVFIVANIHAGEVAGKEALLRLLRELGRGEHRSWLDSMVIAAAPIYNADGNERIRLTNRPLQHGPVGGMGQRPNAQGLDLNRDHIKLESPEARSLVHLLTDFDPHVFIDLHTTDGTVHAYHLTYSPPLHPATSSSITGFLRDELLPAVTDGVRDSSGWELYYYGNLPRGDSVERGWYTFDHRPRFSNNYAGLRNRLGILSEAYSYARFADRIRATELFVEGILDFLYGNAGRVVALVENADNERLSGGPLPVRAEIARGDSVEILLGEVSVERNPYTGEEMWRRRSVSAPERMPDYGAFAGTDFETVPSEYLVPAELVEVTELLMAHGVVLDTMDTEETLDLERFRLDTTFVASSEFQGHRERTVEGEWEAARERVPAGTLRVILDQPLGRLIFILLEPRSDDGVVNWNLVDQHLAEYGDYPILRRP